MSGDRPLSRVVGPVDDGAHVKRHCDVARRLLLDDPARLSCENLGVAGRVVLRVGQHHHREGDPQVSSARFPSIRPSIVSVRATVVSVRGDCAGIVRVGRSRIRRKSSIVGVSRIDARIGSAFAGPEPGVVVPAIQNVAPCPEKQEQDRT